MYYQLIEATLAQLGRKQQSITRLFPDFFSNPVKIPGIIRNGGLRMTGTTKDTWEFSVSSGTEAGLSYDVFLRWKNIVPEIQRGVANRKNWNVARTKVNLKKLAAELFKKVDVELDCECPADLYYGAHYIRSQDKYRAKYGEPENRSPDIRNPKQYGAFCKHIQALFKALPWYKGTMASWLKEHYASVIKKEEQKATKTAKGFQKVAKKLGKMKRESKIKESHSHNKCMKCSSKPEIEILWAEGRAHAWFCMKHLKEWASEGDGWHEVDGAKEIQDGKASKKWADNTSPNIVDTLKLKESTEDNEKEKHFTDRTNKHIQLVQGAAAKIVKAYPEWKELLAAVKDHDASKLQEPERTPYIEITWRHKLENEKGEYDPYNGKGYQKPGKLEKEDENKATLHHITTNSHHPEYHLENKSDANINSEDRDKSDECVDASRMPDLDIAEMIADWQAMSEELQTNTAREWFDKQKDVRWHFSEDQEELIDMLLEVFE